MFETIERLRKKPRAQRERIALWATVICVALLIVAWIPIMRHRLSTLHDAPASSASGGIQELTSLMSGLFDQGQAIRESFAASSTEALASISAASSTVAASSTGDIATSTPVE